MGSKERYLEECIRRGVHPLSKEGRKIQMDILRFKKFVNDELEKGISAGFRKIDKALKNG